MSGTCLVLGGKGFVGSAITRVAGELGWDVTPCGREDLERLAGSSWDLIVNANGNSKKYLSDRDPLADFNLSVRSVAASMEQFTAKQYVFLSTVDVYPDKSDPARNTEDTPIDPVKLSRYGFHKWLAEQIVRRCADRWLILRVAGCVGNGLRKNPVYDLLTGSPLHVHPESRYQYLDSTKLAEILFGLVSRGAAGGVYNLAGEGTVSVREVAAMLSKGVPPTLDENLPRETYQISIDRIKCHFPIEESSVAVNRFVSDVLAGRTELS